MPVEEPALRAATRALDGMRTAHGGVRWVRGGGLHLTLHFFGRIEGGQLAPLLETVRPAAETTAPFGMVLSGLGCFPDRGAPRVLWLGVREGAERLVELALRCRTLLATAGVEVEARPYAAHCTLGRPKGRWSGAQRAAWLADPVALPPFTARRVVMFESVPGPGGAVYTPRGELALAG